MILEKYSCEQYAGVQNQDIAFEPGMNVVLGDNEVGKSTMISGILDTLQVPFRIDRRDTGHKDFLAHSFPTSGANVIDGKVRLTLGGEHISVEKEWDRVSPKDNRMVLRYVDSGVRLSGDEAQSALNALLQYGKGVYDHIIFGRQNNEDKIMDWLFSFLHEDGDLDITQARERVSGAASVAGGISEELFLQKLEEKLKELGGRWDFDADAPEGRRDINKPWDKGVGKILSAYYDWRRQCADFSEKKQLIEDVTRDSAKLEDQKRQRQDLEKQKKELLDKQAAIQSHDLLRQQVQTLSSDLTILQAAQEAWPLLMDEGKRLDELIRQQKEQELRKKKDALEQKLAFIRQCAKEISECHEAMKGKETIEADAKDCQSLQSEIDRAQIRLQAMKLNVTLALEGDYRASVESAGGTIASDVQRFADAVNGYAKITIPGVGEMTVAPESVDVAALTQELAEKQAAVAATLKRYSVQSVEELNTKAEEYRQSRSDCETWTIRQTRELDGRMEEEIVRDLNELQSDPSIVVEDDLEAQIAALLANCVETSLESRRAVVDKQLKDYGETYRSLSEIGPKVQKASADLEKAELQLAAMGEVSMTQEEYEETLKSIERQLKTLNDEIEAGISSLSPLMKEADKIDIDAMKEEQEGLEVEWIRLKKLYARYARIKEDFERLQQEQDNQYSGFYGQFNEYLQIVAGNELSVSDEGEIVSRKNALGKKELLSQGTRKLILLAFRLSLLKYYYQDEGGVIVLDDILLDMDPGRRARAAKLLTEFAKENQVIFTTCDPAIAQLLGGHQIKM